MTAKAANGCLPALLPFFRDSRPVILFVLLFASYAYFYQAGGWNQNSRFALVRAITNERTLNIDPFQRATGDKASFNGHYYSDKAPGLALTAVPVVALARPLWRAVGGDPETLSGLALLSYFADRDARRVAELGHRDRLCLQPTGGGLRRSGRAAEFASQ